MSNDLIQTNLRLSKTERAWLKVRAQSQNQSMTGYVRSWLEADRRAAEEFVATKKEPK